MCQGNTLPPIFVESIKYLDEKGMEEVGLFRVAGDQGEIQELEAAFKQTASGEGVMESNSAILTVPNMASLLKLWLRNLTTSLIPEASYEAMMQYANSPADFSEKVRRREQKAVRVMRRCASFTNPTRRFGTRSRAGRAATTSL